jgi:hypothetical protein
MKRLALGLVAAVALVGGFGKKCWAFDWTMPGANQDVYASTTRLPLVAIGDCAADCACDDFCCDSCYGGLIVDADLLFLQFHQNAAFLADDVFNYDPSVRLTLGFQNADGLGVRTRLWDYDHSGADAVNGLIFGVDTFNIDMEAFQAIQLTDLTSVELSLGIRYNDFRESVSDGVIEEQVSFAGFGGIAGIKARRQMLGGAAYANVNSAILMDDVTFSLTGDPPLAPITLFDSVVTQTEIGAGYEWCRYTESGAKIWLRAGYEWWVWTGYSSFFLGGDDQLGFGGFVFGGGGQF